MTTGGLLCPLTSRNDKILKDVEQTKVLGLSAPVQISCSWECLHNFAWIAIMQAILLIGFRHNKGSDKFSLSIT